MEISIRKNNPDTFHYLSISSYEGPYISTQKLVFVLNRYASYAAQPSQTYGQSAQVRFNISVLLSDCDG